MNQALRNYRILTVPAAELKTRCSLVHFPLSQETEDDIRYTKACLRKSFGTVRTMGLAAPQVGILKRFFIMPANWKFILQHYRQPSASVLRKFDVFINPIVLQFSEDTAEDIELCLSVPLPEPLRIKRPSSIIARYNTPDGKEVVTQLDGMQAKVFQHETDHLEGLTIDRFLKS